MPPNPDSFWQPLLVKMSKPLKSIQALAWIFLGLCSNFAGAATITAVSPSYSDVSDAVSVASNGDTVQVPAGSATWSSTLDFGTKAISLIGAGSGSTIIRNNINQLIKSRNTGTNLVRISGFRFEQLSAAAFGVISFAGPSRKVRVDHCIFSLGDVAVATNHRSVERGNGPVWGVVDHCQFYNMGRACYPDDVRLGDTCCANYGSGYGSTAWAEGAHPGTEQMMYWEDNQFVWNQASPGFQRESAVYGGDGGSLCFRYNNTSGMSYQVDAHGDAQGQASMLFYEIYGNTFNYSTAYSSQGLLMAQRGGQWIVHDNTFNTGGANVHAMMIYLTADTVAHRVQKTYVWGNTVNTVPNTRISFCTDSSQPQCAGCSNGACPGTSQTCGGYSCERIRKDFEWFDHAPTSGQAYFPYTTYTYPHPLVTGGGGPPPPTPTPTATPPILGLSFDANAGVITNPFTIAASSISQAIQTTDPTQGGRASYTFAVATAGDYLLSALVNCPDGSSNSFFVNIDAEPSSAMIWTIPATAGSETRVASWPPNTTQKAWTLTTGTHQLIIRGREANAVLQHITLGIAPAAPQGLHVP